MESFLKESGNMETESDRIGKLFPEKDLTLLLSVGTKVSAGAEFACRI